MGCASVMLEQQPSWSVAHPAMHICASGGGDMNGPCGGAARLIRPCSCGTCTSYLVRLRGVNRM